MGTVETFRGAQLQFAGMFTQVVDVTPALAAEWLKLNSGNRPISKSNLQSIVNDMRAGHWNLTHQGIAFDQSGALIDGQHRLLAVVQTGLTVKMLVCYGADRATFSCIDGGRKRTAADAVAIRGIENANAVAALARALLIGIGRATPTRSQIDRVCVSCHDTLQRYVPVSRVATAPVGAAFVKASLAHWRGVDEAAARLVDLAFPDSGDPINQLAIRLRKVKGSGYAIGTMKYALAVSALRAVHEGRPLFKLQEAASDIELDLARVL
jgi:hypothetical protein